MIRARCAAAVLVLLSLAGGADTHDFDGRDTSAAKESTRQQAKARPQAVELDIAASISRGDVVEVDQMTIGILLDCGDPSVDRLGATTVTSSAGTEPEPLVRAPEARYQDIRFDIRTRTAAAGHYEVRLRSPASAEIYLIGAGWDHDTIRIASGSECFTLPEDEFIGGDFQGPRSVSPDQDTEFVELGGRQLTRNVVHGRFDAGGSCADCHVTVSQGSPPTAATNGIRHTRHRRPAPAFPPAQRCTSQGAAPGITMTWGWPLRGSIDG